MVFIHVEDFGRDFTFSYKFAYLSTVDYKLLLQK